MKWRFFLDSSCNEPHRSIEMKCPRDQSLLDSMRKGPLDINACGECGCFSVILGQEAATSLSLQLSRSIKKHRGQARGDCLESPFTKDKMSRFLYRGVELDYCQLTNSVWFDRGEYSKIFQSPENGSKPKPLAERSDPAKEVWETIDKAGNTVDVLDIVGDLVSGLISGVDVF